MTLHLIKPERRTLHSNISREYQPALTIEPGDTVRFKTLDPMWGLEPMKLDGSPRKEWGPRMPGRDDSSPVCGPIAIHGAEPGMVLEVRIGTIRPGTWGYTFAGNRDTPLNRRLGVFGDETWLLWELDPDARIGRNQYGHTIRLRPFMGVMGMPPDEPGVLSLKPPRYTGGNIDCKELVEGSTLFLPIAVPGGLFSTGDGHGAQGDGEVSSAVECPMDRVELTFYLRDDLRLSMPRAETPGGWITFGFHEDLNEAMALALDGTLDLLGERFGLPRARAMALASVFVDLRITQIVNDVRGVHAVLPYELIDQLR